MFTVKRVKPDGRQLWLYSNTPLKSDFDALGFCKAPSPFLEPLNANPHLRWHPLRGEWVTYAAYRQNRTFLPPPEYNPLAVTINPDFPTELPQGDWQIAVFDNRFPPLELSAHSPPELIIPTQAAIGKCEVVVFTQDANSSLGAQTLSHFELLFKVWASRTLELGQLENIQYVIPFENRGAEVGVTLNHPHGQIYAYPVVPPVPANMQKLAEQYFKANGRSSLEVMIEQEMLDGRRIIYRGEHAVAIVPACARYPYEVWVAPIKAVANFVDLMICNVVI